jgi:pyridoxal phosphate enzyme (YggS family)
MTVTENYKKIVDRVDSACARIGKKREDIQIVGVCKGHSSDKIREAYECGIRIIGENKTQEADIHQADLSDLDIDWHFIGKLQKNKINRILNNFNFIQSVDGVKSIEHIHKRVLDSRDVFIEINIGEEKTKSGFTENGLLKAINYIQKLNRVNIVGMMAIPPSVDDPEDVRPFFERIRNLKDEINSMNLKNFDIQHLSMGMSYDYDIAIEEGATMIRIGTALFGRR